MRVFLAWLLLGWAGGHHFLLGRHLHGLLWLTSGGGFGAGWLLDGFLLKSYRAQPGRPLPFVYCAQHVFALYWAFAARLLLESFGAESDHACRLAALLAVWAADNCSLGRGSSLRSTLFFASLGDLAAAALRSRWPYTWAMHAAMHGSRRSRRARAGGACTGRRAAALFSVLLLLLAVAVGRLVGDLRAERGRRGGSLAELLALRCKDRFVQALLDCGLRVSGAPTMGRREAAATLGLRAGAGPKQVREAYRRLSLQFHPDKEGGSLEKQVRLNEAKGVLLALDRY